MPRLTVRSTTTHDALSGTDEKYPNTYTALLGAERINYGTLTFHEVISALIKTWFFRSDQVPNIFSTGTVLRSFTSRSKSRNQRDVQDRTLSLQHPNRCLVTTWLRGVFIGLRKKMHLSRSIQVHNRVYCLGDRVFFFQHLTDLQ